MFSKSQCAIMYIIFELYCTPDVNITLYVNHTSIFKKFNMSKCKILTPPNDDKDMEKPELKFIFGGNAKQCGHIRGQFWQFY